MTSPTPEGAPQGADDQPVTDPTEDQAGNPDADVDAMDPEYVTIPPPEEESSPEPSVAEAAATPDPEADVADTPATGAPVDPVAEAQRVIAEFEQSQMQACAREIEAVLTKYGMRLEVSPAQITLVPSKD